LRDPGTYNDREKKVAELKWSHKYSIKGVTSMVKHLNDLSQYVTQVNVKPGVYVSAIYEGACLLAQEELKTWRAQLHVDPEAIALYQGEDTGTDAERKQYQMRCRGIVLYLYWRLCELFNMATPASVIHHQIRAIRVVPCTMKYVPTAYSAVMHLWNQLQHSDKCLASANETESLWGHMDTICLNSGTEEEGRTLRDNLSGQVAMMKQKRALESHYKMIEGIKNPMADQKQSLNSIEAQRLQLAFSSTKGESLQTEEDRILNEVIQKITADATNAAIARNGTTVVNSNSRGRQEAKGSNFDKNDSSRSTSRERDRSRHRHQNQAKKSVPPDTVISSSQELEGQEQTRLNEMAAERVLHAAAQVQSMHNTLASQQVFLSHEISRIPESELKPRGHHNAKEVMTASTQGKYGPASSAGNNTSGGSGHNSSYSCKTCGCTLHKSKQCPFAYTAAEALKFNTDLAVARGRSPDHPEDVLKTDMLNWEKFADSIVTAPNPTQDMEVKMKLIATSYGFRVTPNPDRSKPWEQEKNDNFAKLKAYVLQRMSGKSTVIKKK
jgi:hypothetical protein